MTEAATDGGVAFRAGKLESLGTVPVTEGAPGVDVSQLLSQGGVVTYDPGYRNTGSCKSEITYIDGDAGILRYRGYPIGELAESSPRNAASSSSRPSMTGSGRRRPMCSPRSTPRHGRPSAPRFGCSRYGPTLSPRPTLHVILGKR